MYAIVNTGGKQYRAEEGETITVDKIDGDAGSEVTLDVHMVVNDGKVTLGSPFVKGATVKAQIVRQSKAKKINAFNFKAKKNERKRWGHRQPMTLIKITSVKGA